MKEGLFHHNFEETNFVQLPLIRWRTGNDKQEQVGESFLFLE
jgi:hypothetical protein